MKLEKINNNKKYVRKIESMGKRLFLFDVSVTNKRSGLNNHLFYEDKRKPPLDIAINPDNGMIEYVSCFVQDEMVNKIRVIPKIIYENMGISLFHKDFNENNPYIRISSKFTFWRAENNIWILKDNMEKSILNAYKINASNSLLFIGNEFIGIEFKDISEDEIQELHNSRCLI